LLNKLKAIGLIVFLSFICPNISAKIVLENYGNWKTLSYSVKGAYVTGAWDTMILNIKEEDLRNTIPKYSLDCLNYKVYSIGYLVEEIDLLYRLEENKMYSPGSLLKHKIIPKLCIK
jgi:hypothetical protein